MTRFLRMEKLNHWILFHLCQIQRRKRFRRRIRSQRQAQLFQKKERLRICKKLKIDRKRRTKSTFCPIGRLQLIDLMRWGLMNRFLRVSTAMGLRTHQLFRLDLYSPSFRAMIQSHKLNQEQVRQVPLLYPHYSLSIQHLAISKYVFQHQLENFRNRF